MNSDTVIDRMIKAWPDKASVTQWRPTFEDGPGYDYPMAALPIDQDAFDKLDHDKRQALSTSFWIQYNQRTIDAVQPWADRAPPEPPLYAAEDLYGIVSADRRVSFAVTEVLARILDGSRFAAFKPEWGPTIVCGW